MIDRTVSAVLMAAVLFLMPPPSLAQQGARDCPQCPEMVRIAPGSFSMGAPAGEHAREGIPVAWGQVELPPHRVTIAAGFALGRYEVTRGEFAAFIKATRYRAGNACWAMTEVKGRTWEKPGFAQTERDPVVCVSFTDATAYVDWLKRTTGKNYRLPSEAEWEYAERAGTATARYWGDARDAACRHGNAADVTGADKLGLPKAPESIFMCADGHVRTAPVGQFQPNAWGLHDMLGNASEWTGDCRNDSYAGAPADGSSWQRGDCAQRMVRGGSWSDHPQKVRAAAREWITAGDRYDSIGFRVARSD